MGGDAFCFWVDGIWEDTNLFSERGVSKAYIVPRLNG